ncbi:phage terminase small subunit-related protein, partial [Dysgonomonas sp. 521]|uniref:phage terminase small subunit-related protein n=1 Tax=Dysgonomonas sp. 521 TaxID=2302932 RepID=UPI001C8740A5
YGLIMSDFEQVEKPDYTKLRHTAYQLVVEQGKTQKEAAFILDVSEKSMSEWSIEGNWRDQRKMRQSSANIARENIQRIISLLSDKRLKLEYEINEARDAGDIDLELRLRKEANQASNEMAYNNKALAELNKEKGVTLGQYVDVFDDIFSAMRAYNYELFEKTIEFQTIHLRRKSNELG